jgi:hypothetical protein
MFWSLTNKIHSLFMPIPMGKDHLLPNPWSWWEKMNQCSQNKNSRIKKYRWIMLSILRLRYEISLMIIKTCKRQTYDIMCVCVYISAFRANLFVFVCSWESSRSIRACSLHNFWDPSRRLNASHSLHIALLTLISDFIWA